MNEGEDGARFRDSAHLYADDLECFGPGSLFQLLCTARTGVGQATLARWLSAPADPEEVRARQGAVQELRPRLDSREDLAVLGTDASAGLDAERLRAWVAASPVPFPALTYYQLWHDLTHASASGRWLREQVRDVAGNLARHGMLQRARPAH